jgi:hypothetical protein
MGLKKFLPIINRTCRKTHEYQPQAGDIVAFFPDGYFFPGGYNNGYSIYGKVISLEEYQRCPEKIGSTGMGYGKEVKKGKSVCLDIFDIVDDSYIIYPSSRLHKVGDIDAAIREVTIRQEHQLDELHDSADYVIKYTNAIISSLEAAKNKN